MQRGMHERMGMGRLLFVSLAVLVAVMALLVLVHRSREPPLEGVMIIVEPRAHADLRRVLENFDRLGPPRYDMIVFHGASHRKHAKDASAAVKRRLALRALHTDNLTPNEYNALLKQRSFWEHLPAENILVFQTDAALCGSSPHDLRDFEHRSYIGCSYDDRGVGRNSHWAEHAFYGVGGLSFRKRSAMLACIDRRPDSASSDDPEDVFFSDCVDGTEGAPQSARELSKFCTQSSFRSPSWGAHQIRNLAPGDRTGFSLYCPESQFMAE